MGHFRSIKLKNYRNFLDSSFEFDDKCNIIIGKNGSGKTNILESLSLFEKGRGFRKEKIINLVNYETNEKNFNIRSIFHHEDTDYTVDVFNIDKNEKNLKIKQRLLTFVVVGGGFAGVETAGEINDFLNEAISYYHNIKQADVHVILVEAVGTILQGFNESLSKYAHNKLEKNGIKILLQHAVTSFDGKNVIIKKLPSTLSNVKHEAMIDSHTLVWTAGVTPVDIIQNSAFKLKNGKIIVNEFLEIPNHPEIFAIGDCSQFDKEDANKFPPTAQLAEAHAKLAAYNIKQSIENKEKKKFVYKWKGQSAIIGKHYGIAESMGIKITGFWAWVLWRNYYLNKMPNIGKRIRVWLDWNMDLFSRIDISRYGFKRDTLKEYRELDEVDDVW